MVVGGGIGGLTTALALRRVSLEPSVFERREGFEELQHGTGLTLWSNAIKALRQLGIGDQIEAAGVELETFEQRTWRGARLGSWPIGELSRRAGAPSVNLTRAALHRVLAGELGDGVVTLGAACTGVEQAGNEVIARFTDGREVRGDVLVGADGINSVVRASLFGREEPRYAGYTAWRGLVPFEDVLAPSQCFVQIWGPGSRFAYYHVGGGQLYWIAVANAPARASGDPDTAKHEILRRFAGWTDPVAGIVTATSEDAIQRTDIEDRDPTENWGVGRVTLVGDAIHPMTFNVGQGACQAIEDAVVLGQRLRGAEDVATALRAYEAERKARTAAMMRLARRIGRLGQWENPIACGLRDQLWKHVIGRFGVKGQARHMSHEL